MKKLTQLMDDFYRDLQREAPENIVSHLLRKIVTAKRPLVLKAIVKMLVIEHVRARLAEAEIVGATPLRRKEEAADAPCETV